VRAVVELICTENGLAFQRDRFGNVIVRLGSAAAGRPLVLAAHMDHPGFEIVRPLGSRRWVARFNGGVPDDYFHAGIPVRLLPGVIPARLGKRLSTGKQFEVIASRIDLTHQPHPRFAVWELEDFAVRLFARHELIGLTRYMFDPVNPLWIRGLSLFHLFLPGLLLWLLATLGYDPRALPAQALLSWVVLPVSYLVSAPEKNVNWVFGPAGRPQKRLPPRLYFSLVMLFFPACVYLPSHALFQAVFKRPG